MVTMILSEHLKQEREKRHWSQDQLTNKLNVTRQSVSKWENNKGLPSMEILIEISDLLHITVDELLRSDAELKKKVIRDSKPLAHPKWKLTFDIILIVGVLLMLIKLILAILIKLFDFELTTFAGMGSILKNIVPLALIIVGSIGSETLKNKIKN